MLEKDNTNTIAKTCTENPGIDFYNVPKDAKIVVAMSGGVDSSTTLALLKQAGYKNIVGITLLLFENNEERGTVCSDTTIQQDCKKVAETLGIEHHFINRVDLFYQEVISPFLSGYLSGETINPCVTCNRNIKFGVLLEEALKMGADFLVTGHYIKWMPREDGYGSIYRGNVKRDQSYFLGQVRLEATKYMRFPLANFTKEQVRQIAKENNLHVATKPASNDLCFTGGSSYSKIFETVKQDTRSGNIVSVTGEILAKHNGIHNFTVGQRKGIGIGGQESPYFVIKINKDTADVMVGPKEELEVKKLTLNSINWLGDEKFDFDKKVVFAKVRSSQLLNQATLYVMDENNATIEFDNSIFGAAKGQLCAFYDAEGRLLGSGFIS